jgi:hypothetical protein
MSGVEEAQATTKPYRYNITSSTAQAKIPPLAPPLTENADVSAGLKPSVIRNTTNHHTNSTKSRWMIALALGLLGVILLVIGLIIVLKKNNNSSNKSSNNNSVKDLNEEALRFIHSSTLADVSTGAGTVHREDDEVILVGEDGKVYKVSYDLTLRPEGVVSLNPVQEFIAAVQCSNENGKAKAVIELSRSLNASPSLLFPPGSLLVIDSALFGSCRVVSTEDVITPTQVFEDGFLFVEAATGDAKGTTVTVVGTPASYFDMVPRGTVLLEEVTSTRQLSERNLKSLEFFTDFEKTIKFKLGDFGFKAELKDKGSRRNVTTKFIRAEWDLVSSGRNVSLRQHCFSQYVEV